MSILRGIGSFAAFVIAALPLSSLASSQSAAPADKPEMTEACPGLVAADRLHAMPAALRLAALNSDQVRLTFVGHATFLIESPQLVRIVTDYNDYVRPPVLPDIVTMNHAHSTHYTDRPDPAIKYVLRGWGDTPEQPIPFSFLRWLIYALPISAICTTR
jgi:hypothetical protein